MEIKVIVFILSSLQTILINNYLQPKLNQLLPNHQQQINDFFICYTILISYLNIYI